MNFWQGLGGFLTGGLSTIADAIMNANGIHSFDQGANAISQGFQNLSGMDFAGGPLSALFGETGLLSNPQGAWDNFTNGQTNTVNAQIAKENLEYQKERNAIEDERYESETGYNRAFAEDEREYQRALQERIFEREDTAILRQAESLSRLGINPLSQQMNGLNAGQAVSASVPGDMSARGGSALHNDMQYQGTGVLSLLAPMMSVINGVDQINTNGLQRDALREQNDYQRLLNISQDIENRYKEMMLQEEIKNKSANTKSVESSTKRAEEKHPYEVIDTKASADRNQRENAFQEQFNVTDNTNKYMRIGADASAALLTETEAQRELQEKSPLAITGRKLKDSFAIVGDSLAKTFGSGAKKVFNFFANNSNKKYRTARQGRMY